MNKISLLLPEYLRHRKSNHEQILPTCRNFVDGSCIYGSEKCWFKHGETKDEKESNEKKQNENNDMIQGILKIMEKITEQIFQIEMKHKDKHE